MSDGDMKKEAKKCYSEFKISEKNIVIELSNFGGGGGGRAGV
jgi:hypothetical protein